MAVSDYSTTPDENVTISGINIAEGCAPSGINNAIRQMMADIKTEAADKASSISSVAADLATEVARAQAAEEANASAVSAEETRAQAAEKAETARAKAAEAGCLPLSGGALTGDLTGPTATLGVLTMGTSGVQINQGSNSEGAELILQENSKENVVIDRNNNYLRIFASSSGNVIAYDPATGQVSFPNTVTIGGHIAETYTSVGSNYIRFGEGTQICWGTCSTQSNNIGSVTFPQTFATEPHIAANVTGDTSSDLTVLIRSHDTSSATFLANNKNGSCSGTGIMYVAVGRWY